ncbi:PrsW family glutamic-type intramembrane protease [Prosthecobacter vanneervenii]|uniref:RsiW-degrading membrane proteinase PrsW (M82 family) n=1 Tax=Prosthecobacter vanneervenii TaxID=48466 RepID=A0A7W7Y7F6_9BACT|nr:PrsW family glutamic-type intramembrane protease [Prosthecobacter vanneervenii]MBB5031003.1 RsiW-degrading membrane proteinase PrsW (M82 family) [Prosthecobacter vanneervenii]
MSEEPPWHHGWRASTHRLSRDRQFLLRTAAGIIASGVIIACVIVVGSMPQGKTPAVHAITPELSQLQEEFNYLRQEGAPQPRAFARWLRLLLDQLPALTDEGDVTAYQTFSQTGMLGGYELAHLIQLHASTDSPAGLFRSFLAATLAGDAEALRTLTQQAASKPPLMLAAELLGSTKKRLHDLPGAAHAFYEEGFHFVDAASAREEALRLAITQRDLPLLRAIAAQPGWIEECHPWLQHHAGSLLGDVWLQWRGLLRQRLNEIPYGMLALAFFAAALWYFILVQHTEPEPWRWLRPMGALTAGILSVWPTLTILAYQEFVQGMTAEAPFPHDLLYYLTGVGLREEGCKLLLFSLFLPWLLWRRTPGLALLTGAFIGLGFSLEENIGYYQDFGGSVAWTRFLSANFLHISLTGICAHSLYHMLLTRFAHAEEFIMTFLLAVAAHGGYDYLSGSESPDIRWLSIVVLVLSAARFIDLLCTETHPSRRTISPLSVFTLGSAVLIAISFVLGAWSTRTMGGVAAAGQECLSMVPIALLYWRRFENT